MLNSSFINLETSILLKKSGFNKNTDYCIAQYQEDFIYDNDPEHPESHKAGDIRIYNFSWIGHENCYPTMSIADAVYYCRETLGYNIYPILGSDNIWAAHIQTLIKNNNQWYHSNTSDIIIKAKPNENTAEDVLNEGIIAVLQCIINNETLH